MLDFQRKFSDYVFQEKAHPDTVYERGSVFQRARMAEMAELCCQEFDGDLIEIGCYAGTTSALLAGVARKYSRTLVCVDNWQGGDHYELDKIGLCFNDTMKPHLDVLKLIKGDAHEPDIIQQIQEHRYCFCFSDDGHSYEAHLSELLTLLPVTNGMIAVDDVYVAEVRPAIDAALKKFPGWRELYTPDLRESWVIKVESGRE